MVRGINKMLDAILLPIAEGNRVLRLIRGGNLREKVEIECHGDHQRMKDAINGVHDWLSALVAYVTALANGDLTANMDKASDQDQIHEWLMLLKGNIAALVADADMLAKAAIEGKLNTRADASKHQGDFRKIVDGVNGTIGTLVGHFDTIPAPVMIIDRDYNVQYMNTAGAKLGGRTAQQVVGGKCYDHFKTGDCRTENCACCRAMSRERRPPPRRSPSRCQASRRTFPIPEFQFATRRGRSSAPWKWSWTRPRSKRPHALPRRSRAIRLLKPKSWLTV